MVGAVDTKRAWCRPTVKCDDTKLTRPLHHSMTVWSSNVVSISGRIDRRRRGTDCPHIRRANRQPRRRIDRLH